MKPTSGKSLLDAACEAISLSYMEALETDRLWNDELIKVYGREACEARYDARGRATAELARLDTVNQQAGEAMRNAFAAERAAAAASSI